MQQSVWERTLLIPLRNEANAACSRIATPIRHTNTPSLSVRDPAPTAVGGDALNEYESSSDSPRCSSWSFLDLSLPPFFVRLSLTVTRNR